MGTRATSHTHACTPERSHTPKTYTLGHASTLYQHTLTYIDAHLCTPPALPPPTAASAERGAVAERGTQGQLAADRDEDILAAVVKSSHKWGEVVYDDDDDYYY